MPNNSFYQKKIGAVLVVGGGIGGMQSALDLAQCGIKVYLVDSKSSIGGVMSQLDKTFPTNDCAMCTMAPRLVETGRNKDIEIITLADIEKIAGKPGNFRVSIKKRARYIDEEKCTGCGECPEVCPINVPDEHNVDLIKTKAIYRRYPQAVPNTYVIEKIGQSPCRIACPAEQKVQGYIALIKERRYEEAYQVILRDNPLPSVCGRVCKHYCEDECTRSRVDQPVSIMNLKRFIADWAFERKLTLQKPDTENSDNSNHSKEVAVIGSGPAGLTAARDLNDMGYSVTIFEALPEAGGTLRYGIPEFRLPRERLKWDIQNILANGIQLVTNHKVASLDNLLKDGFEAVFVGIGSQTGQKLPIPGNNLPDVLINTDFLKKVASDQKVTIKDRVLVLGGGNVAMDVARTALRLGAKDVKLACLESRQKMPADPWEVREAEDEGVTVFSSRSFLEISSRNGNVTGVKCVKVNFHGFDENGKPDMDIVKRSEHIIAADTVIFAIGQVPEISFVHEGIELTKFGTVKIDKETYTTSKVGVFAGGDVVSGSKFIVDAIASGHRAAQSIDLYLKGDDSKKREPDIYKVELTDSEIRKKIRSEDKRHEIAYLPVAERKTSFIEFQQGYTEDIALAEANRCLECGICSECFLCVQKCEADAINHDMPKETLIQLDVGAIILSPGFEIFDSKEKEDLGYGRYQNVISALEFERILSASGPYDGNILRPSDNKTPGRIAFIQCVGSRDAQRDYCSSICCMYSTKEAIIAKEHVGKDLECDIFLMDMRAFAKGFEEYYVEAKKAGVNYIRCRPPSIEESPDTQNLFIKYLIKNDMKVSREYDLVVLAAGIQPPESNNKIAETFNIQLNDFNFCKTTPFKPVESTRAGIYVSGPFTEPKDIPETVMQASGAASKALSLLQDVKGSLIVPKEYPPEIDVMGQDPRIGVFICHCGTNISGVINVTEVLEYTRELPDIVYVENNLYTCSNDTQEKIKEKIKEHNLNRVIVASCTPRTHEPLFRNTIREAGLNQYLFEMANIRDQCSWVHRLESEKATEKAKDLINMAAAKARLLEPLQEKSISINKSTLVIGGGLSGMTAAYELANQGFDVYLVEKEKELGGNLRHIHYLFDGEKPQVHLKELINNVKMSDKIRLFTETQLESVEGSIGNFKSKITSNGVTQELEHGVIIIATGAKEFKPEDYLYKQEDNVITQLEFEQQLGTNGSWLNNIGNSAKTVVMIQCVGSLNKERQYCSRICCTESLKNALKIKELSPETNVYVLYRDLRVYGFKESYYSEARKKGVVFIRYEENAKPVVYRNGDDELRIDVFDQILEVLIEIPTDLVILSTGIVPHAENHTVAQLLKVPLDKNGFFLEAHLKLRPVDFATEGIFLCGLAHSAKAIDESIIQAQASVSRASTILSKDRLELGANISQVLDENCDGCAYCIEPCPYNALTLIEYMSKAAIKKTVERDETACKGCGCCQATCPKKGIIVSGFKLEQIEAQIHAFLGVG